MKLAIGGDHAGFSLKQTLVKFLEEAGHQVIDCGCSSEEPVDYPDFSEAVSKAVLEKRSERGIIICGSGVGASVTANKIPGIRAGLCHDTYSAHQGVDHDDMNILVMGSRVIGIEVAKELTLSFLKGRYTGEERHARRLKKMQEIEIRYSKNKKPE